MEFYSYKSEDCSSHFDIGYLWSSAKGKNKSISSIWTYFKKHKDPSCMFVDWPQNKKKNRRGIFHNHFRKKAFHILLGTGVDICTNPSQHKSFSLVWQLLQWNQHPRIKSEIPFTCWSKIISPRNFQNRHKTMNIHRESLKNVKLSRLLKIMFS